MRTWVLLLLVAGMTWPVFGAQPVTVAKLKEALAAAHAESDERVAFLLSDLQLTERLSSPALAELIGSLHGAKSTQALIVLADLSAFLNAPAADIPADAAPDEARQRQIMAIVVDYVARMNRRLPDFFATRTTTRFEDWPKELEIENMVPSRYIPPQMVDASRVIVTYRNGKEDVSAAASRSKQATNERGLNSWGLFGPILSTVLVDASRSSLNWSHWEQDKSKRLAVFRYVVPFGQSNYEVKFCCVPVGGNILSNLSRVSAYHGEITVDPDDGTILRLTLMADLDQGDLSMLLEEAGEGMPLSRADLMVEYGPLEIGGKVYFCPTRSVSVSRAKTLLTSKSGKAPRLGPARLYVNDVSFTKYHLFRSDSSILPGLQ